MTPDAPISTPAILGGTPVRPVGPPDWPLPQADVAAAVSRALCDGTWGKYHGPHIAELTARLAADHACEFAFPCASGTAAVELALRGLHVGPGDEVVLSAYDFKANFQNVLVCGATPVLVDVLPGSWIIDPAGVAEAFGPRTKALLVSHLHGVAADMPALVETARAHGVRLIEDAAQMPGASIAGRPAGSWGDIGILSFGGSKLVTAGRGGALFTPHADIAQRIRLYTQRGNDAYPLSELQGAAVLPQWHALAAANAKRSASAGWLRERLARFPGLAAVPGTCAAEPAFYKLGFLYDPAAFEGLSRDAFSAAVRAEGIAFDPGFRGLHQIHAARRFRAIGSLPHATHADGAVLSLHHPVLLGTEQDLAEVVAAVEKVAEHAAAIGFADRDRRV